MGKLKSGGVSGPAKVKGQVSVRVERTNSLTSLTIASPVGQVQLEAKEQRLLPETQSRTKKGREWVWEGRQRMTSLSITSLMKISPLNGESAH